MQSSLSLYTIAALFASMLVLALVPSVSVLVVSARSAASGMTHGVFTTAGVVVGDIVFIMIAIFGLSLLADTMGSLFVLVKFLGGVYLILLGGQLWRGRLGGMEAEDSTDSSLLSSFLTGLFVTLGDQKAILFYLGFFPAFFDLSAITYLDTAIIIGIATVAIFAAKLGYAIMADRVSLMLGATVSQRLSFIAGGIMIAVGVFLLLRGYIDL